MRASIPTNVVDNSYAVFPEGTYTGALQSAEVRDPKSDGSWLTLKVGLDTITPMDGTTDPGRATFKGDFTIATDGHDLREIEDFSSREIPFSIVRSAGLIAGMAEALGVANRENGQVDVDIRQVLEALTEGNFAGERVAFEVTHYSPKNSDKTYEQFNRFGTAG
jgi:hypothetical protein